jgi:arylsulfatase A-like enzyme
VVSNMPPFMEQGMPTEQITIAEVLRDAGYYTAHIGKWHLGHEYGMDPMSQGFQDSLGLVGPLYLPEDHPDVVNARFDTRIDKMIWGIGQYSANFNGGDLFAPDKYVTDYYTDEALKVIENNKNRPFFLYLSHWAIHNPLQALRSDFEQMSHMHGHNLQVYSGMINSLDRSVGKIIEKLKELDIYGKTLIIFTSDNGGANYIELNDINKPYRGWKISFFDGGIRVPYIISWPDEINPGKKSENAVHHFDIFPTILRAAGIESTDELDGVDLMPFIKNDSSSKPHKTLFWRSGNHQSVLHEHWKFIISKKENFRWLFDTSADPTEKNNLVDSYPDVVKQIEELLIEFNSEQKDPLFPSSYDVPIMIDKYDGKEYEEGDEYIYWSN